MMWYNSVDKKTSVYNTKKAFLARFWYHIFWLWSYSKISKLCILDIAFFLHLGCFCTGYHPFFLKNIECYMKHYVYCQHLQTQGVCETICTLHGISNVVEATWEYRFINSRPSRCSYESECSIRVFTWLN